MGANFFNAGWLEEDLKSIVLAPQTNQPGKHLLRKESKIGHGLATTLQHPYLIMYRDTHYHKCRRFPLLGIMYIYIHIYIYHGEMIHYDIDAIVE